ncbi:alpha/beta fold hydrolase [Streptomyces sp. NPDC050509]|uniref:alpha/beta fold hydrolase n=1 Tax=Streptomyces sp. NPDC050509 TaxID=3365620 RepID=UPI0037A992C3
MTAFVLVSGSHTGGWVWREVTALLRAAGSEVYAATLTGMGDRRHLAGPDTDLETHIQDVVNLIDTIPPADPADPTAPGDVVLVGHCYGIHPVLGAADRRTERVARIVHLDAGLPQNGDTALALAPDQAIRDRLAAEERDRSDGKDGSGDGDGRLIPPPPLDEPERWGGTAGIPEAALERLARHAAPQPLGTLTQPLRLPNADALAALPTTGIFCTANGSGIALVEMLVGTGQPRFQALAQPWVGFFELDTGHWPMLSAPDELAGVLLRAAADEGRRVTAEKRERPAHLGPFLLDVPDVPDVPEAADVPEDVSEGASESASEGASHGGQERTEHATLYFPRTPHPRPAVVFVHGGPLPADTRPTPRDWPVFTGYGRYVASLGAVGVTVDHRLHGLTAYARAAEDIATAVERVRADPRVDGERVALWFFSGGGLLLADWLAAPPPWLRCVAATYPVLAPLPGWGLVEPRFRPAAKVGSAGGLPIVLTRVGRERPEIAATVEEFLTAAGAAARGGGGGARVEVIDVPLAHHGFETADHGADPEAAEQARHAVERAARSVLTHLTQVAADPGTPSTTCGVLSVGNDLVP